MSYTDEGLPFQDGSQASYRGAIHAGRRRSEKMRALLSAYADAGARGLTDAEAVDRARLPLSSICSLRNGAKDCGLVEKHGERMGTYGVLVTVWILTAAGVAAAREAA